MVLIVIEDQCSAGTEFLISSLRFSFTGELNSTGREGKFGCNVAHLDHYSEIAEKSMENFVSVISSFRFTSNGSRASGLRAPLRDIKNTPTNR